ncbi:MAG: YCF48-related protein [Ignavibacteria bacterium]
MKTQKFFSRILDGLILLVFLLFFSSAGFQDKSTSGWYKQFFPNLNGSTINDITFLDSLTGFAVTTTTSSQSYILKTTNGGDNWNIVYTYVTPYTNVEFINVQFANNNTGYASTNYFDLFKTTNGGLNWVNYPNQPTGANDFCAINTDTLFYVSNSGFGGGVYRSADGGINWGRIWTNGTAGNPDKIYMFDKNLGFIQSSSYFMQRTTNGGFNWTEVSEIYTSIKFFDSNTGWKVYDSVKKTTNGGINWVTQKTPIISSYFSNYTTSFSILNKDTVWMVGAEKFHKPPVYKTTNGGLNWGYQYPDTTLLIYNFEFIQFVNSKVGWVNPASLTSLMHTTIGGNDTTYITGITNNSIIELSDYQLFQNYPNPFNAISKIKYKISKSSNVKIEVMNILGRNIQTLVNKKQSPGIYEINFSGENLGSGIYFYSLNIDGKVVDTKKLVLLK